MLLVSALVLYNCELVPLLFVGVTGHLSLLKKRRKRYFYNFRCNYFQPCVP